MEKKIIAASQFGINCVNTCTLPTKIRNRAAETEKFKNLIEINHCPFGGRTKSSFDERQHLYLGKEA